MFALSETHIRRKARILCEMRRFFDENSFVEVDTPILQPALVPELNIDSFRLGDRYLLPSPELAMKALLCGLSSSPFSIYQLSHCFRREDVEDALHRQEFLMLEFYAIKTTAMQLLELVRALLQRIAPFLEKSWANILEVGPRCLHFDEITQQAFGLKFSEYWESRRMMELYAEVSQKKYCKTEITELSRDDLFHLFLVEFLEPYIEQNFPYCVLYPYPDVTPLPARQKQGGWVDRWELYLLGRELANACREENRATYLQAYQKRFVDELCATGREKELAKFDFEALQLWEQLPDCSGAALGLDRLLAL